MLYRDAKKLRAGNRITVKKTGELAMIQAIEIEPADVFIYICTTKKIGHHHPLRHTDVQSAN